MQNITVKYKTYSCERKARKEADRPSAPWHHFIITTTTKMFFVFPFVFKLGFDSKALIFTRKQNPEGFLS